MHDQKLSGFDKEIKTKLESKTPVVPPELWNRISSELDACESESIQNIKIFQLKNWRTWISIASILCILTTLGILIKNQDTELNAPKYTNRDGVKVYEKTIEDPNSYKQEFPVLVEDNDVSNSAFQNNNKAITVYNLEKKEENIINSKREDQLVFNVEQSPLDSLSTKQHIEENPFVELQYASSKEVKATVESIDNDLKEYAVQTAELLKSNTLNPGNLDTLKMTENLQFSNLLNFVISRVDKRQQKFVKFSNDDEGSIRVDFNLASLRK